MRPNPDGTPRFDYIRTLDQAIVTFGATEVKVSLDDAGLGQVEVRGHGRVKAGEQVVHDQMPPQAEWDRKAADRIPARTMEDDVADAVAARIAAAPGSTGPDEVARIAAQEAVKASRAPKPQPPDPTP